MSSALGLTTEGRRWRSLWGWVCLFLVGTCQWVCTSRLVRHTYGSPAACSCKPLSCLWGRGIKAHSVHSWVRLLKTLSPVPYHLLALQVLSSKEEVPSPATAWFLHIPCSVFQYGWKLPILFGRFKGPPWPASFKEATHVCHSYLCLIIYGL